MTTPRTPKPKPNPLLASNTQGGSAPGVAIGGDSSWRDATAETQPLLVTAPAPASGPKPQRRQMKARRVDTSALTGVRGLAAIHVAAGHMFSFSTLRLDLIGGAAMPFFYLLSGFVMTLGYGQSEYAAQKCCCMDALEVEGGGGKQFNKGSFWRNRFARLAPVYFLTNSIHVALTWPSGGMDTQGGIAGTSGPHAALLGAVCSVFGVNTWFLPFFDVGLPPNSVCWTITTMAFFYWVFPYALPRMQRLSSADRSWWIVQFYWWQLVAYVLGFLWAGAVPVPSFEYRNLTETPVLEFVQEEQLGYWIARAWPVTRVMVFFMGCLAALNRLDVHEEMLARERGDAPSGREAVSSTKGKAEETAPVEQPADIFFGQGEELMQASERTVIGGACSCWRCGCCRIFGACTCCLREGDGQNGGESAEVWAGRVDFVMALYWGGLA